MARYTVLAGLLIAAIPVLTAGTVSSNPAAPLSVPELFEGAIVVVEQNHLTMTDAEDVKTFLVPGDAVVLLDGHPVALDGLRPGMLATVMSEADAATTAKFIEATRQY